MAESQPKVMVDEVRRWPHARGPFRLGACHLTVDGDSPEHLDALHAVAARIGLSRRAYQPRSTPHYDLTRGMRAKAVEAGAVMVPAKEQAAARLARRRAGAQHG